MSSDLTTMKPASLLTIRNKRVMLDRDVAAVLGVETRQLNENSSESPKWGFLRTEGIEPAYRFQLTREEVISEFPTSNDFAKLPWAYTQRGCAYFGTSMTSPAACRLAVELSEAFVEKQQAVNANLHPVEYQASAVIVESVLKIGVLLGASQSLTKAHAVIEARRHYPACDLMPLLAHNTSDSQELDMIPTDIGKALGGISAIKVNKILADSGFQTKIAKDWAPTDKGQPFAQFVDTGKKHSNGTPVKQLKWKYSIVNELRPAGAA